MNETRSRRATNLIHRVIEFSSLELRCYIKGLGHSHPGLDQEQLTDSVDMAISTMRPKIIEFGKRVTHI